MPSYVVYSTGFQTSVGIRIASPSSCSHPCPRNSDSEGLKQDLEIFIKKIKNSRIFLCRWSILGKTLELHLIRPEIALWLPE